MSEPRTRTKYTYDSLYRLARAVTTGSSGYPAWGLSEAYDRYGNRSAQAVYSGCTGITCPTNSVTPDTSTNRISGDCYDANGNLLAESAPPCPSPTYVYDAENHMVNYSTAAYTYDGNGLRVKKVSGSTTTVYIFSGSKVIAEYDNGAAVGSPSREYIYAGTALLAKIDSSGTKYYHQDHLSNRLVTDSSGNTVTQMGHFPYGESWYNALGDKLIFTTYERDSESGNDYAQARYYISRLARFSSPDPVGGSSGDPQSLNRYSYVRNSPVSLVDPSGLTPKNCLTIKNFSDSPDIVGGGPFAGEDLDWAEPQSNCFPTSGGGGTCTLDGGDVPCDLLGSLAPPDSVVQLPPGLSQVAFIDGAAYFLEFDTDPDVNAFELSYPYLSDVMIELLRLPTEIGLDPFGLQGPGGSGGSGGGRNPTGNKQKQQDCATQLVGILLKETTLSSLVKPGTLNVSVGGGNWVNYSFQATTASPAATSSAILSLTDSNGLSSFQSLSGIRSVDSPSLHVFPQSGNGVIGHVDAWNPEMNPPGHLVEDYLPSKGFGSHPSPCDLLGVLQTEGRT
jgi:RHS repeat-associated protein